MNRKILVSFLLGGSLLTFTACGNLQQIASSLPQGQTQGSSSATTISQSEANNGVKQALNSALQNSINSLSAENGYFGNAAVKILMPAEAQKVEKSLRAIGMGSLCDKFIMSLNRAAESAVKEAAPVFVNSLSQMTVTDAFNILLSGQQDAATNFFKRTTSAELTNKFSPIIQSALGRNSVDTYWSQLTTAYNNLPLGNDKIETNLNAYVTQKAIDGLFIRVGDEELKIRNNIGGSRNTNTLEKVFGWVDSQKK